MGKRLFKSSVKADVGGPVLFHAWADWSEGHYVVGEYISSYESTYRGAVNQNFKVKVEDCNFTITNKEGREIDPNGQTIVLNGNGKLNKFFENVKIGMMVEVAYAGKKPGNDGTEYHTFERLEAGYRDGEEAIVTTSHVVASQAAIANDVAPKAKSRGL